jgi:hypothetical protein
MGKVIPWTDFLERKMDKAKDPFDLDLLFYRMREIQKKANFPDLNDQDILFLVQLDEIEFNL